MPAKHYVTAQMHGGANRRIKRLVGPFDTALAALRMIRPVERALRDVAEYDGAVIIAECVRLAKGKRFPPGVFDLALIDPADVIHASRRR